MPLKPAWWLLWHGFPTYTRLIVLKPAVCSVYLARSECFGLFFPACLLVNVFVLVYGYAATPGERRWARVELLEMMKQAKAAVAVQLDPAGLLLWMASFGAFSTCQASLALCGAENETMEGETEEYKGTEECLMAFCWRSSSFVVMVLKKLFDCGSFKVVIWHQVRLFWMYC